MIETIVNQWLQSISSAIAINIWLAPLLALIAGIATSITPCSLTSVALVIGYVGGTEQRDTRRAFRLSVIFAVGMAVTFTVLGSLASLLGGLFQNTGSWVYLFLGVLMLMMALQIWEIFNFIPSSNALNMNNKQGFLGAFIAGVLGGFFSSPCATPVLVVLLAIVATEGSIMWGILLLLLYSLGHSFLVVVAGTSVGFVNKLSESGAYDMTSKIIKTVIGTIILILGMYMLYLGF